MECPFCSHTNIDGVDECAHCQADLSGIVAPGLRSDIEEDLLSRPLGELATHNFLEMPPDRTAGDMLREWVDKGRNCVIVTEDRAILGIVTERDVLNKLADKLAQHTDTPIRDFMTSDPATLDADVPVAFGLNRMMVGGYRHIPIERDGRLAGMVSVRDILAYLTKRFADAIKTDATA